MAEPLISHADAARDLARRLALQAGDSDWSLDSAAMATARATFVARVAPALHGLFDLEARTVVRERRHHVILFGSSSVLPPKPPPPNALATRIVLRLVVAQREPLRACASVTEMLERIDIPIRFARTAFLAESQSRDSGPFDDALVRILSDLS
jgi:hypothetical protein